MHSVWAAMTATVLGGVVALGQPGGEAPAPAKATKGEPPKRMTFDQLPAPAKLGVRSDAVRRRMAVAPVVVITPDAASYAAAVEAWSVDPRGTDTRTLGLRYPVLIDDGTRRGREDIARFVRAFKPKSMVRFEAPEADRAWLKDSKQISPRAQAAAYGAWGTPTVEGIREKWKGMKYAPPGVVVACPSDPAWTAAVALAGGRGELILWVASKEGMAGAMPVSDADAMCEAIEKACKESGYSWDGLGDDIDAVTLCLNIPAAVRMPGGDDKDTVATTDLVGRSREGARTKRWAWAGQVYGTEARAAYMAMCSLFLEPEQAWLFDGYENKDEWARYDVTPAAVELEKASIPTVVNDNGRQGADDWRKRGNGAGFSVGDERAHGWGVNAGFIAVNTKGFPDRFELSPGECRSGDVPFLRVPAIVHFTHSWSAARLEDRGTIAGRFMERGAYAYFGSVKEPYLQAFVPTPLMVKRVLAGAAWGAAIRLDDAPMWRLAVVGDPLMTVGTKAPRVEVAIPLKSARDIAATLSDDLKGKRYAQAIRTMVMQGRDSDVLSLVRALDRDEPSSLDAEVAESAVMSVFYAPTAEGGAEAKQKLALVMKLVRLLEPKFGADAELKDIAWHAAWGSIFKLTKDEVEALVVSIRVDQSDVDARVVAEAARQSLGRDEAAKILMPLREKLTDPSAKKAIDDVLK